VSTTAKPAVNGARNQYYNYYRGPYLLTHLLERWSTNTPFSIPQRHQSSCLVPVTRICIFLATTSLKVSEL